MKKHTLFVQGRINILMTRLSIKIREILSIRWADGLLHLILFSLAIPLDIDVVVCECTCVELFIFSIVDERVIVHKTTLDRQQWLHFEIIF